MRLEFLFKESKREETKTIVCKITNYTKFFLISGIFYKTKMSSDKMLPDFTW